MEVVDARRLTGPNLQTRGPAAICEVAFAPGDDVSLAESLWRAAAVRLLEALDLPQRPLTVRRFETGATWLIDAPIDELYGTITINDWACSVAIEGLGGEPALCIEEMVETVKVELDDERDGGLLAVQAEAHRRHVPFLWDDDQVSLGFGRYAQVWERSEAETGRRGDI